MKKLKKYYNKKDANIVLRQLIKGHIFKLGG